MPRYLLPVFASIALVSCGNGEETGAAAATPASLPADSAGPVRSTTEDEQEHGVPTMMGADLANGQRQFRRCQSCHTINEGGRNMVGPNLYGILGQRAGRSDAYNYSQALSQEGLVWDVETLDQWIENPRALVPGNRMSFVGLRDADDRRDLIAYLASVTASGD